LIAFTDISAHAGQPEPFANLEIHLSRTTPQRTHTLGFSPEALTELF